MPALKYKLVEFLKHCGFAKNTDDFSQIKDTFFGDANALKIYKKYTELPVESNLVLHYFTFYIKYSINGKEKYAIVFNAFNYGQRCWFISPVSNSVHMKERETKPLKYL